LTSPDRKKKDRGVELAGDLSSYLVTLRDPTNVASESYRTLRANLLFGLVDDPPRVIVITSPGQGEGKSITCANLGVVLAQVGKNVLIIDCDLRKPAMDRVFGLDNSRGLITVLVQECGFGEATDQPLEGLEVLTVGPSPPNPTEVLSSQRFANLLWQVREQFDYVLIDGPPVGPVSDPAILSVYADGTLLVIDAQNTRKGALRQSVRSLQAVGAEVLGVVMNNARDLYGDGYYGHARR
jgi:capsular exopolysaccharide synthesis family protein